MNKQSLPGTRAIITGATGMVGEGVLIECLKDNAVTEVLAISRRPCGITHPKLKEVIHTDFYDLSAIEDRLGHYDACFFCAGVSSVGMKEAEYYKLTYALTMHVAQTLARLNPDMTFCYVSGAGTDSSEEGKIMWARVKGKTENSLMELPFKTVYNFRPGFLEPTKGMRHVKQYYKYIGWLTPLINAVAPKYISTLRELGRAMINAATKGYEKQILEVPDIKALAKI
ncbi:NAD-dependent epimerase/dehydratase family protein [Cesiribacter sp. SM1]|uniref:NAD-dependent epimerase/dehydratase family protein n=1 Tax=Cesiribacter sp. SM1 TaxID=2861196 RepID=UPI001CD6ADE5|nr:NAD-dependent epimerase/dehydratase family protein [Cesiribacter sp. SM1]